MKPLKSVVALVIDRGLFCEMSLRLAKDLKKVYYLIPNDTDPFPTLNPSIIGSGFPEIEVVDSLFGPHFDEVDLFCFFDCGDGELQDYLVRQGKMVWGSRMGCDLELDRPYSKELLKEVGLPVGRHQIIKGVKALRLWLKEHRDQFVKVSKFRGTTESFYSRTYKDVEPHLDEMEFKLGPLKDVMVFDVEDSLPDKAEVGSDSWSIDGETPSTHLCGIEVKDSSYAGKIIKDSDIPKPLRTVDEKMEPLLKGFGYRGFYSTECRIGKDGVPYMIDFCARCGNPPGFLQTYMLKNYSQIIWQGANGYCIEPEYDHAYGVQLQIKSAWSDQEHWQPISFKPEFRSQIKIVNPCKINGQYFCTPLRFGIAECGSVVGTGDSIGAAIKSAKVAADTLEGYMLKVDDNVLDEALEACEEAAEMGINLGIK